MVEQLIDMNTIKGSAVTAADTTLTVVAILFGVAILIGVIIFVIQLRKYKHKFRIKEVIEGRKIYIDDRAREYKDQGGAMWWKLLKMKDLVEIPPPEAIELDNKGKKCVEAYRLDTGEYMYIKDEWTSKQIPSEVYNIDEKIIPKKLNEIVNEDEREAMISEWKKVQRSKQIKEWANKNKALLTYQPLTTNQRLLLIKQIQKAEERRKKKWQDYLLPLASLGALVIVIVAGLIFWGDLAKPAIKAHEERLQYQVLTQENLKLIKEINTNVQTIKSELQIQEENKPKG